MYHLSRETFLLLPAGLSFVLSPELSTTDAKAVLSAVFVPNFLLVRISEVLLLYLRVNLVPELLVVAPSCSLTLYSPVVTICTTSLALSNSTFFPHIVFMCFVWI
jgi:hypothetical protein